MSLSAHAADVQLFANINVVDSAAVVTAGSNGSISDVNVYESEETFVIGKATVRGMSQQIIAKVSGCGLVKDRSSILLRISIGLAYFQIDYAVAFFKSPLSTHAGFVK